MAFAKLDSGITKSSLWSEPIHVRIVFISFLAEKDENGFVCAARSGMIRTCNVTPEQFDEAEKILMSPDAESKNKDFEGRRIDKIDGGWIVLNHDFYRLPEQEKKEKRNVYMKEYMSNKRKKVNIKLTEANTGLTSVSVSESVSESVSVSESEIQQIYDLYPNRDYNGRSTGKCNKDKEKIKKILINKKPLKKLIIDYVEDCNNTKTFLKNFSTFLSQLPEIPQKEEPKHPYRML